MPKEQEEKLKKIAAKYARQGKLKRRPNDSLEETKNRFIYGTMINQGTWKKKK
jgi:hypothetical protein